jgi:tetratricopeptide (TPR) repeat protein
MESSTHDTDGHATDHAEVVSPTPAQDLELAMRALDEGDPSHAAHHLAGVLGVHPLQRGIDEALARWLASVADPVDLVPIPQEGAYRGLIALRAFALQRQGRVGEACRLLLCVQAAAPELHFAARVIEWLERGDTLDEDPGGMAGAFNNCVNHPHLAEALLPALRLLLKRRPAEDRLAFAAVRAARNAGKLDEALAIADEAYRNKPSWGTATARALALRAKGDIAAAIAAYRDAARLDPSDLSAWLDIGDICVDERADVACEAYDAVLAKEPEHSWALPSRLFLRWRDEGQATARARLLALAERGPADSRAAALARAADPYEDHLPCPASSVVNGLAQAIAKKTTVKAMGTSSLEAPSNRLVVEGVARRLGMSSLPAIAFGAPPQPDPRIPRGEVAFRVWTYKARGLPGWFGGLGTVASPAVDAPREHVAKAVAELASQEYSLSRWAERARSIGGTVGSPAVADLLATMVHPPAAPEAFTVWDWIFRIQVAAALCLAAVDRGWAGSTRERALMSLWLGPIDWTTTAALIALTEIACSDGDAAAAIVPLVARELDGPINPMRWSCIVQPMLWIFDRAPISDAIRRRLGALRKEAE